MSWLLDTLYGTEAEEKRAAQLDRDLAALNRKDFEDGDYGADVLAEIEANRTRFGLDGSGGDGEFSDDIAREFGVGWNEGADNIRNFAGDTINTVVGTPLKLIPWQVWLAGALYLAWRLGLFNGILAKVRR